MAKIENLVSLEGFSHGLGVFEVKKGRKTLEGVIDTDGISSPMVLNSAG